jgi:pyruvate formate lyase activating enzyme
MKSGLIGSIERYRLHDGPGIRTTVFLKGCPLGCPWCHNPELRSSRPEVASYPKRCIRCGDCEAICDQGAASLQIPDRVDRPRCTGCGACADVCPARAIERVGRVREVDDIVETVLRDRRFYETSGGGVTLSGGEPMAQGRFSCALLRRFKQEGLHTTIETTGFVKWSTFAEALEHVDLVLFDFKLAESREHRRLTGEGNECILENLERLLEERPGDVIVRVPLIPGYTATEINIAAISDILRGLAARRCSLLPYHPYGRSKAESVGTSQEPALPESSMTMEEAKRWRRFFQWTELVEP